MKKKIKNNQPKTKFTGFYKKRVYECTRKAWIVALNQKEDTSVQSQHTNVIVLLCTAKTQRLRSLMGKLTRTDLTSVIL